MDMNLEKAAWILAVLVFLPALLAMGGFVVAAVLAVAVLGTFYGGRYGLRVYEQRQIGKEAGVTDLNRTLSGSDDKRWRR